MPPPTSSSSVTSASALSRPSGTWFAGIRWASAAPAAARQREADERSDEPADDDRDARIPGERDDEADRDAGADRDDLPRGR